MTYYISESSVQGANEEKLIVEIWTTPDVNAISWDTYSVSVRVKYSAYQAKYSGDNQTLNRTGMWGGSTNFYMPASANKTVVIADETRTVSTQEGSSVNVTVGGNISGHYGVGTGFHVSRTFTINARPYPASKPTLSSTNFDMGSTITINTNRLNGGFTHTIEYAFGTAYGTIGTGVGASTTWNFPIATLAPQVPAAVQGNGSIICKTYNGSTHVGTESVGFTAKVPASVVPVIGATVVAEGVSTVNTTVGKYVKGLTKFKMKLTGCAGIQGSSINKQEVTVNNVTYDLTNGSATSVEVTMQTAIAVSGSVNVVGRVVDSRGRLTTKTTTVSVLDYALPNPEILTVKRALSTGVEDPLGTYAKIRTKGSIASLLNGTTEKNALQYQIQYREAGASTWLALKAKTSVSGLTMDLTQTLGTSGGIQFLATKSYEFLYTVFDKFNSLSASFTVGTSEVTLSLNKTGIGVGKVWSRGSIDAAGDIFGAPGLELLGTTNLNTVYGGNYIQTDNANATSARNYPTDSAGLLEVAFYGTNWGWQRYTVYGDHLRDKVYAVFIRGMYNGSWKPWVQLNKRTDTGWKAHGGTVTSGINTPKAFQYRIIDNMVWWKGQAYRPGGWTGIGTSQVIIRGFASEARPPINSDTGGGGDLSWTNYVFTPDGDIELFSGNTGTWPPVYTSYLLD